MKFALALPFLLLPLLLPAKDFGLLLDQTGSFETYGEPDPSALGYTGTAVPWFSTPLGPAAGLYLSAAFTAKYENRNWTLVPELLRTELTWSPADGMELRAGRIHYEDPLGFIAEGLFDGAAFSMPAGKGRFNAGAYYTGFLYKKSAHITMTRREQGAYYTPLDYGDFAGTYFAPRRFLVQAGYEHRALAGFVRLKLALLGQGDLSGGETTYHSQYLAAKAAVPAGHFVFTAGAALELAEIAGALRLGLAGELALQWMPPTEIQDRLTLLGRFSSGAPGSSSTVIAFTPLTTESQGNVLKAKLSGISMVQLAYTARILPSLSALTENAYFILSDPNTYEGWPLGRNGRLLGGELFAALVWSPVQEIRVKAGGGIFLPSLGNAAPAENPRWRIELNVILAAY